MIVHVFLKSLYTGLYEPRLKYTNQMQHNFRAPTLMPQSFQTESVTLNIYTSRSSPVTASSLSDLPGPMPSAVTVPGGISVRPASVISDAGSPAASASIFSSYISGRSFTCSTIFFCPPSFHALRALESACSAADTAACATCTASFPRESFRSSRMMMHCLYSVM